MASPKRPKPPDENDKMRALGRTGYDPEGGDTRPYQSVTSNSSAERPRIVIGTDEHRVVDEAVQALSTLADVYHRGGMLVRAERDVHGWQIRPLQPATLRELLTRAADWCRESSVKDGPQYRPAHPPEWAVAAVAARGSWPGIKELQAIVEAPTLRPDGTVFDTPGCDVATQTLYLPSIAFPAVSLNPTASEVRQAIEALCEAVADFPFASETHRAAWLAGVVTMLARPAFAGPAPLFLIDGNTRGCGKSLLADIAAIIATGRDAPRSAQTRDEEAERKRITGLATRGGMLTLLDNLSLPLGSAPLDAALTSALWEDRLLGSNRIVTCPLLFVWWATGNNVRFRSGCDTARRTLHIRLETSEECPEQRSDFRHSDLRQWVRERRPRLVWAALTLLRGYCAAGRPDQHLRRWGSYEGWSGVVRGTLVWAGLPDPFEIHDALAQDADSDADMLSGLLTTIEAICTVKGATACTVADVLDSVMQNTPEAGELRAVLSEALGLQPTQLPDARVLGYTLRRYVGRVVGIERRPSGRWRFKLTFADGTRRASPTFETREECERVLEAALAELAAGNMAPIGAMTLGPFGERWLADLTLRSAGNERMLWRLHVADSSLAAMPIVEIRQRHLRDFVTALGEKRKVRAKAGVERVATSELLSAQTVKLVFALVRRVLSEAVTEELIDTNPAKGYRLPREAQSNKERWTYLSADEIEQLLGCVDLSEARRLLFQVAIFTGMRAGELWGLRWGDVELDRAAPLCSVRRSYDGPTKSSAVRSFPLLPCAVAALQRLYELADRPGPSALVFPSPSGGMFSKGYDASWAWARQKAGIHRRVRFHDLRHTCASHLLRGTWGTVWSLAPHRGTGLPGA